MDSLSRSPEKLHDEESNISHVPSTTVPTPAKQTPHQSTTTLGSTQHVTSQNYLNEKKDEFLVTFDGPDDVDNPKNWSVAKRWYITVLTSGLVLNATFASSSPSGVVPQMMEKFGFGTEVATLTISLFVAGYCFGPIVFAPLSETYGRRPIFLFSFLFYTGFQIGCALSPNTTAILVFRFLGGVFASSPLANSGAVIGDIWDAKTRGKALALFSMAPFAGPALGPAVGGFIGVSGASWRWLFWTLTIFAGLCFVFIAFTLPETYAPVILKQRAEKRRKETGDDRWQAPIELVKITASQRVSDTLTKPWKVLFSEPMLIAITIYMAFVYGCLYLMFEAYPIIFQEGHGFNAGIGGLMFLPLFIGAVIGCTLVIFYYQPKYEKHLEEYAPSMPPPEVRLPMAIPGSILFTISFFWLGWTSFSSISYWVPMLAGGAFGLSLTLIFLSLFNYILDTYLSVAASALASTTVIRSACGAGFPLFASQMFKALNPRWASTLLGCVALLLAPIPVLFIRYGPVLRAKSRYSATPSS